MLHYESLPEIIEILRPFEDGLALRGPRREAHSVPVSRGAH